VESSEVGGCRGGGIARFIPRIPEHRLGGNGSSPDVGRPLGDGLRVTSPRGKNVSPIFWRYFCQFRSHQKQSLPPPLNPGIGVNPRAIAFDLVMNVPSNVRNATRICQLALRRRIPAVSEADMWAKCGLLLTYGQDASWTWRAGRSTSIRTSVAPSPVTCARRAGNESKICAPSCSSRYP
jgi:hypothetical protein